MTKFKKGDVVTKYKVYSEISQGTFVVLRVSDNYVTLFDLEEGYQDSSNVINLEAIDKAKPFKVVSAKVDGYTGYAFKRGKEQYISVGCRVFNNLKQAKSHWALKENAAHHRADYDDKSWVWRLKANAKRYAKTQALVAKLKEV